MFGAPPEVFHHGNKSLAHAAEGPWEPILSEWKMWIKAPFKMHVTICQEWKTSRHMPSGRQCLPISGLSDMTAANTSRLNIRHNKMRWGEETSRPYVLPSVQDDIGQDDGKLRDMGRSWHFSVSLLIWKENHSRLEEGGRSRECFACDFDTKNS